MIGTKWGFVKYVWVHTYKIKVKCGYLSLIELYGVIWNICINAQSFIVYWSMMYAVVETWTIFLSKQFSCMMVMKHIIHFNILQSIHFIIIFLDYHTNELDIEWHFVIFQGK